ncbi:uncharacterized protein LOC101857004 [Aplysia californica]|uniref:Uncharacterized protein LOC101857004 n=1 Tax=Aplysia californica TaxID=6500 RepID=A0ABM0JEB1_APLCA|nr:uncharacterized protein LOC101857004 [Aplysia californica]
MRGTSFLGLLVATSLFSYVAPAVLPRQGTLSWGNSAPDEQKDEGLLLSRDSPLAEIGARHDNANAGFVNDDDEDDDGNLVDQDIGGKIIPEAEGLLEDDEDFLASLDLWKSLQDWEFDKDVDFLPKRRSPRAASQRSGSRRSGSRRSGSRRSGSRRSGSRRSGSRRSESQERSGSRERSAMSRLFDESEPGRVSRNGNRITQQFEREGTWDTVMSDFNGLRSEMSSVRDNVQRNNYNLMIGTMPDGSTVIARDNSSGGWPTLEFQSRDANGRRSYRKIRYSSGGSSSTGGA